MDVVACIQPCLSAIKKQALLKEAELKLKYWPELEHGEGKIPTLGDFTRQLFPYWTREFDKKPGTRKFYSVAFRGLLLFDEMRDARLDDITPKLIERYKEFRIKGDRARGIEPVGLVTLQHSLRALRRALRIAVQKFEYRFIPPKFDLRKEPQRDYVVSEADFQGFLQRCGSPAQTIAPTVHVQEGAGRETMQAILTVLYDGGLRPNEAVHLTWDRVNLGERWLFVDPGKTKAARRRVPLTSRVVSALVGLRAKARDGVPYVFTRYNGHRPITACWVSHEFLRMRTEMGLPKECVLYALRHSCATRLGNKGCTTTDLMKIMGWETPAMAIRYTHLDDTRMAQIISFLEPDTAEEKTETIQ